MSNTISLVKGLDLSSVLGRVQAETGLDSSAISRAESLYRQFLVLRAKYEGFLLVPPKLADVVWHTHITDTRRYMADCTAVFGEYLHHTPAATDADLTAAWETTKKLYKSEFGVSLDDTAGHFEGAGRCS